MSIGFILTNTNFSVEIDTVISPVSAVWYKEAASLETVIM